MEKSLTSKAYLTAYHLTIAHNPYFIQLITDCNELKTLSIINYSLSINYLRFV